MSRIDYSGIRAQNTARRKLAQMWVAADPKEKTRIAGKLRYGGKPESARRAVRRLLVLKIKEGQKVNVTNYFKPYVLNTDKDPRTGRIPPFTLQGNSFIHSGVMMIQQNEEGLIALSSFLNGYGASKSVRVLFRRYSEAVELRFKGEKRTPNGIITDTTPGYDNVIGIAFSSEGARELIAHLLKIGEARKGELEVPLTAQTIEKPINGLVDYGIVIMPTHGKYETFTDPSTGEKKTRRVGFTLAGTTARDLPRNPERRRKMIQYINRAYAQKRRWGTI